ncbi:MAG: response regulator, partial [Lachnospiraceae bacterium]|nr:response regulator [Lachnospiraceae bacterium]
GYNRDNEKVFVLGKAVDYMRTDGKKSDVLFVVLPFDYFNEDMYLAAPDTRITSHIIDKDGDFIIGNGSAAAYSNLYDRIENDVTGIKGKKKSDYVKEIKKAIENDEDYSTLYKVGENTKRLYLVKIAEGVDWYVLTDMPYNQLGSLLNSLDGTRYSLMFGVVLIIIVMMLCLFLGYYRLSHQQMIELAKAREAADKANKAKSHFLTSMSHDIRTPMNAIIGMSDIAMKNIDNPGKASDCLKKVQLSSRHLLGLINDILDMTSIESGKLVIENRDVALHQLTSECVSIMQSQIKAKKQNFDVFIGDIISEHIYGDSIRLEQVLLNLLSNANKYTQEGGTIHLRIYQKPSSINGEHVRTVFEVQDNGIGMSEDFVDRIFDKFAREDTEAVRNINGSGLGMAITKSIIDMIDGTIDVQSKVGEGTTFSVVLDMKRSRLFDDEMKLPAWKVLVVDDNEELCQSAADTLGELGLIAEWTQDGMEAVHMVEEHHKADDDYHFVLVDWKMPNMDGVETIRELRKRISADIPVFIISAYSQADVENVLGETEIAGFIAKPLFKSNLYEHLNQYIDHEVIGETEPAYVDFLDGKTFLLAEDNDINAEIVEEIMSSYGATIHRAENGRDCIELFMQSKVGYYDAVFMDVHMPIMDGYEATRIIREMDRGDNSIPIIAMTADVFSDNIESCKASGMNECITKPLDMNECLRVLKKHL